MTGALTKQTMTVFEAQECVKKINENIQNTRALLLDLYEREGWAALGYGNWRDCVVKEFGGKHAYAYFQLSAAKVERNLSTIVEKPESIPETHLRPLTKLPPDEQKEVYQKAVETAPEGKVTAKHIEKTVNKYKYTETHVVTHAMEFAMMAIIQLERIDTDDPKRQDALAKVARWIEDHKEG